MKKIIFILPLFAFVFCGTAIGQTTPADIEANISKAMQNANPEASAVTVADPETGTEYRMTFRGANGTPVYGLPKPDTGTPLIQAARLGDLAEVRQLLDEGADINAADKAGKTALMHASEKGQSTSVVLLLDRGALFELEDNQGHTALDYANRNRHEDTADILRQYGARF